MLQTVAEFVYFNLLNGAGLLLSSIDRLIVVTAPLFYFRHTTTIMLILVSTMYTVSTIPMLLAVTITAIEPPRNVSRFCL